MDREDHGHKLPVHSMIPDVVRGIIDPAKAHTSMPGTVVPFIYETLYARVSAAIENMQAELRVLREMAKDVAAIERRSEQAAFKMAIEVASESHYLGVAIIRIRELAKERAR
jgi:hypothetical protein